jgi:Multimeric flavodoxin WrbA
MYVPTKEKILGLVGSPRKNGNTEILVSEVLEGARAAGALTHMIRLADLNIQECDGCHACWITRKCSKNDDMVEIYNKIIQSDILIFGSPIYWYAPTAIMKCFIDRFVYFNCEQNRKGIRGKKGVIVIPFEEKDSENAQPVIFFFEKTLKYLEIEFINKLIVPGVTQRGEVLKYENIIRGAYELGKTIVI